MAAIGVDRLPELPDDILCRILHFAPLKEAAAAMAAIGVDRLSELPDDILCRILHFAPLKEAASTTALSRRWRTPLWLSSGALNLETGVIEKPRRRQRHHNARFFSGCDDLVCVAKGALDAADLPVRRLTLITWYPDYDEITSCYKDLVEFVLSHPVARRVEELLLVNKGAYTYPYSRVFSCPVTIDSLQLETLRILELNTGLLYNMEAVLPRLSSIRLGHCRQHLGSLQRVIEAAPVLVAVQLQSVCIYVTDEEAKDSTERRLRCPATTVLLLDSCRWEVKIQCPRYWYYNNTVVRLDVDAMRLRRFSYKGVPPSYSFSPQPLELEQVDLDFFEQEYKPDNNANRDIQTFWRFTRNFTSTKEMRLKVNHLEDIVVLSETQQVKLLPVFRRLERLECQGAYWTKDKNAPLTTILNLLHCCPALSALRINLTPKYEQTSDKEEVHRRTTRKEILAATMVGPRYLFECLQSSLRRVDLQFELEKRDCFGVKLMKTFAENAMVLEEIRIDSGDEKLCEHMNRRVEKWNSSRRELGATSFVLLPLKS